MAKKILLFITVISFCLLVIILNITTPATVGPFGILMIFLFMYLSLLGITSYLLYGASYIVSHLASAFISKKPVDGISINRAYHYSTIVAAAPIMLIGLQSVGSIGVYEFMLVFIFTLIGCLYIAKRI